MGSSPCAHGGIGCSLAAALLAIQRHPTQGVCSSTGASPAQKPRLCAFITGQHPALFRSEYGNDFVEGGVGRVVAIAAS